EEQVDLIEKYFKAQGLFGSQNDVEYSRVIELDLGTVKPSVSGPSLPQQRVDLGRIGDNFLAFMEQSGSVMETGSRSQKQVVLKSAPVKINGKDETLTEGDVVIAAITSCTNTSNPYVMLGAGLLAKKAVQKGLRVNPKVKTSLAPGSRVVSEYLKKAGLQEYLDKLGFELVGFGCTTCIGNSGPLNESIERAIVSDNMSTAAVLSGNRNFEARIHRNVKANYLMSPPLVVAFALAGRVTIDMDSEPLGLGSDGKPVFLKDIWPTSDEILSAMKGSISREMFVEKYRNLDEYNPKWKAMEAPSGKTYAWDEKSTYIRKPPFFDNFNPDTEIEYSEILDARPLLVLGDSVTTDHISPAGSFSKDTPAGKYLMERGVMPADFNSYGSRRGNHEVMMRGTFANNRIKNLMVKKEGGFSVHFPDGKEGSVFDVAMQYMKENVPEIVLAGDQYGTGSSRDWAAKGPFLLGVKAVVATGYERIHRSNLVGMGIVPLQFRQGETYVSLKVDFSKPMDVIFDQGIKPLGKATFRYYPTGSNDRKTTEVTLRVDTPVEAEYLASGGILQFVLGKILRAN
ncbi:MAG: aconitate hydratase AcnA, partial [Candidatus Thermoplasmatota archaeon]|nr:aconitate hydratase AcnA [Candidatus Thermoplasmatota archaeon]